ncbi:MAG: Fur family transcriptional regulator [Planctomycetota bacterium]
MTSSNREQLLEVIRKAPGPLSAAEIWDQLRRARARIGLATVYRILKAEVDSGTVEPTEFPGGHTRFGSTGQQHHHHFLCEACDRAFSVAGCVEGIEDIAPSHFAVSGHAIMLFGQCEECQETQ